MRNHLEVKNSYSLKSHWGLLLLPTRIIYTVLPLIPYIRNLEKIWISYFQIVLESVIREKKLVEPYDHSEFQPESTFQDEKQREEPQKIIVVSLIWEEEEKSQAEMARSFGIWYQGEEKYADWDKNLSSLSFCRMLSCTCK